MTGLALVTRPEMTWYLGLKGHPLYRLEKLSLKDIRALYNITKNPITIKELDIKTLQPELQANLALASLTA